MEFTVTSLFANDSDGPSATQENGHGEQGETSWLGRIIIICFYSVLITATTFGNFLVIVSFLTDRGLRKRVANVIIFNLALADVLIGCSSLPMYLSRLVGNRWLLGEYGCKIYSVIDFVAVTMSILMVVFISLDRYCLLKKQMRYPSFMTHKRMNTAITITWLSVSVFWSLIAFGWTRFLGIESPIDFSATCVMEYLIDPLGTLVISTLLCSVPFAAVLVLNVFIFIHIRKQWSQFRRIKIKRNVAGYKDSNSSFGEVSVSQTTDSCGTSVGQVDASFPDSQNNNGQNIKDEPSRQTRNTRQKKIKTVSHTVCVSSTDDNVEGAGHWSPEDQMRQSIKIASKLAPLVVVFSACWVPINIIIIVSAFCGGSCFSQTVWDVAENILWSNSAMNPFLYALSYKRFRGNAFRLLGCPARAKRLLGK